MAGELQPERIHGAVVMESHPLASPALDEEEERALLAEGAEHGRAERDHQPHHTRQHLVDLREVHRSAAPQPRGEPPGI